MYTCAYQNKNKQTKSTKTKNENKSKTNSKYQNPIKCTLIFNTRMIIYSNNYNKNITKQTKKTKQTFTKHKLVNHIQTCTLPQKHTKAFTLPTH